jgi:ubiquinone/menaquinone biosynthesis C-methylase UbiE
VWTDPRLAESDLATIYAEEGYWTSDSPKTVGYGDYRGDEELYLKTFRRRLDFALGDGPRVGKALDVGAAAGFCMQVLHEMGFDVYGVEPSREIASHAEERFGLRAVHVGTLDTFSAPAGSFDLITMWDVVEHVVDPAALLRRARELISPRGAFVLETQNIDSVFARLLGRRWHHYKHAEHIYHFTPRTISALLRSCGFQVETLTPRFAGKYVSLEFIAERASRLHPGLSRALRPLTRLKLPGLYVNVMDEMIVVARPITPREPGPWGESGGD